MRHHEDDAPYSLAEEREARAASVGYEQHDLNRRERTMIASTHIEERHGPFGPTPRRIGGSMLPAIMGLDPYRDPLVVYAQLVEGYETEQSESALWGVLFEEVVAEHGAAVYGLPSIAKPPEKLPADGRDWLAVSLDFVTLPPETAMTAGPAIPTVTTARALGRLAAEAIEVKTHGAHVRDLYGEPDTDQVPHDKLVQCTAYLEATGLKRCHLFALFGGQKLERFVIDFDAELAGLIIEAGAKFWRDHVLARVPPSPGGGLECRRYLEAKHPEHRPGTMRPATPDERRMASEWREIEAQAKALEAEIDLRRNGLRALMGDAEGIDLLDIGKLTYRKQKDTRAPDWEAVANELARQHGVGFPELRELARQHETTTRRGPRVLRAQWSKGD